MCSWLMCKCSRGRSEAGCQRHGAQAGFTILELLVALGIMGLIAAIAVPQVFSYLGRARTETARLQLNALSNALELYALDLGTHPTTEQGLAALIRAPAGARNWNGPYLKKAEGLIDPWGRPYQYRSPAAGSAFEIFSLGRDNAPGGTGENADVSVR